jgi:putative heme-binding domain-containing protein
MVWFSLASRMPEDLERAFQLIEDETPMLPNLKSQMLWYAAKLQGEGLDRVMDYLSGAGDSKRASATLAMALALRGAARVPMPRRWNRVSPSLYQSREPRVRRAAERLAGVFGDPSVLPRMRVVLADTAQDDEERFHAMDILGRFRDTTTVPLYMALLDEPAFRQRAMQLLAHLDAPHLARTLLERLDQWSGQDKRVAFDTLTSRSSLALPLLDAVIEGKVDAGQLTAFYLRQMQDLRSLPVDQGIEKIWGQALPSHGTRLARIEALQEMYTQAPLWAYDADEGRKHFQLLCGPCHQSQGQLAPIGPSLEGSGTSGSRYFLESIIDPHAVIGQPYQVIEVQGAGGDILSGLLLEENETGVVIRTLTDTRQLDKAEITARRETKQSMMPEGLLDTLTTTQIIELLKYLTAL